jgi:hypothetical protein
MPNMGLKLGIYDNYLMMYLQEENELNWMTWEGGGGGEGGRAQDGPTSLSAVTFFQGWFLHLRAA